MQCCVAYCRNSQENISKSDSEGTTYHGLPMDQHRRAIWLKSLGLQDSPILDSAVVCSQHFLNEEICNTDNGMQVQDGAIPVMVQICMICLDTDRKMFSMKRYKLENAYENLTGFTINKEGKIRQTLCVECAHRLKSFSTFRNKSLTAHSLMMDLISKHELITIQHMKTINRDNTHLKSNIVSTFLQPDHCDFYISHSNEDNQMDVHKDPKGSDPITDVTKLKKEPNMGLDKDHMEMYLEIKVEPQDVGYNDYESNCYPDDTNAIECSIKSERYDNDGDATAAEQHEDYVVGNTHDPLASGSSNYAFQKMQGSFEDLYPEIFAAGIASYSGHKAHPTEGTDQRVLEILNENSDNKSLIREELQKAIRLITGNDSIESGTGQMKDVAFSCDFCEYRSVRKSYLMNHLRTHTGEKPYSCEICGYKCALKGNLTSHMRLHTGEKPFSCDLCEYKTARKYRLVNHMRIHTGEKTYSCELCKYKTVLKINYLKHMANHTIEKPLSCKLCEYKTARKNHLSAHMRTHTGEKPFSCPRCNYKCSQKSNLTDHMRIHTGEKPFSCSLCDYKSAQRNQLVRHIKTHTGEREFSCTFCEYKCAQKNSLANHMRVHTGEKPFSCKLCDYKSNQKSHVATHMKTHTGERAFSCNICEYKCSQKTNLTDHMRIHNDEKPYTCDFCEYTSIQRSLLARHMRKHNEKPFFCTLCDYKCGYKSSLASHMLTHTGEKPFSCQFCDYKCAQKTQLVCHIRGHTGEKPFSCEFCDYKTARKRQLTSHMTIHTGEKPLSCQFCEYRTAKRTNFNNHIRIHTGEKPFSCNFCEYRSAQQSHLARHMRVHAGEKINEPCEDSN